jgi:hypothetical protein
MVGEVAEQMAVLQIVHQRSRGHKNHRGFAALPRAQGTLTMFTTLSLPVTMTDQISQ